MLNRFWFAETACGSFANFANLLRTLKYWRVKYMQAPTEMKLTLVAFHDGDEMKILVLCGDTWHPPEIPRKGLEALPGMELTFDFIEDTRDWSPEILATYPLVILTKSDNGSVTDKTNWMTDPIQTAFCDYVQQGNGLLAIHSGTAEYEQKPVIRGLLGGVFLHHPEQCLVTMSPHLDHPLCSGLTPFTLMDEHYFMALDDPQAEVFMTTRSVNGEQPGAWRREVGKGRVAVLTPGHNLDVWLHPSYQALLINMIRWCGRLSAASQERR